MIILIFSTYKYLSINELQICTYKQYIKFNYDYSVMINYTIYKELIIYFNIVGNDDR